MWHIVTVFILPLISFASGLASLFIDPKTDANKKWILIVLMLLSAVGSASGNLKDDRAQQKSAATIQNDSESIARLTTLTEGIKGDTQALLLRFGWSFASSSTVTQSISADAARSSIKPLVASSGASSSITIKYYPKDVDSYVVKNALKEGGFKQVILGTGNAANANAATNAIWVGDSVSLDQAKFVALTLVRAGVGIVLIRGFRDNTKTKADLIEIGTDQSLKGAPLTVEQITGLTQIAKPAAGQSDRPTEEQ
jgi:hypothetical protein